MLNKIDLLPGSRRARLAIRYPGLGRRSRPSPARGSTGCSQAIAESVPTPPVDVHALIPWDRGDLVAMLYRDAEVRERRRGARGHPRARAGGPARARRDPRVHDRRGANATAAPRAISGADADRPEPGSSHLPDDHDVGVLAAFGGEPSREELQPHRHRDLREQGRQRGRLVEQAHADALRRARRSATPATSPSSSPWVSASDVVLRAERDRGAVQEELHVVALGEHPRGLADLERALARRDRGLPGADRAAASAAASGSARCRRPRSRRAPPPARARARRASGESAPIAEASSAERQQRGRVADRVGLRGLLRHGLDHVVHTDTLAGDRDRSACRP